MSRKSTASLSVVQIGALARLSAPDDLTPEQAKLWAAVVDSKPAEWFAEDSAPLLKEYVRAVTMCDLLEVQIQAALACIEDGEPSILKTLLDMRDKESKRVLSTGTKMRLTQQSRYTPGASQTASNRAGAARPWQAKA